MTAPGGRPARLPPGVAVTRIPLAAGVDPASTLLCDSRGIIHDGRSDLAAAPVEAELAAMTNRARLAGGIGTALRGAVRVVVATGRSDLPNQINNVLAFPGVFRGALSAGATRNTDRMKLPAAGATAARAEGVCRGQRG